MQSQIKRAQTVAVIGAGNSGQAVAGFLALSGYEVRLWNRDDADEVSRWLKPIVDRGGIDVEGAVEGFAPIHHVTTDIGSAVTGADVIIVNTTADAYQSIGKELAPFISADQALILLAAGTLGSIDMWQGLIAGGFSDGLLVGETSAPLFGSRAVGAAKVNIAARNRLEIASLPSGREDDFGELLPEFSFIGAEDVLISGFNNSGPGIHVAPMVLTAGWIEAHGGQFAYYSEGITPSVAAAIEQLDAERIAIARKFGYEVTTLIDDLTKPDERPADNLLAALNATYPTMPSTATLDHRFLWEDTLAGAVPLASLAELAGVSAPMLEALVTMSGALLGRDFRVEGRTARSLGLEALDAAALKNLVRDNSAFSAWKQRAVAVAV